MHLPLQAASVSAPAPQRKLSNFSALASISLALTLSACATLPSDPPRLSYATAASKGGLSVALAGQPSRAQIDQSRDLWTRAVVDAYGCGLNRGHVAEAGLIAAAELATMATLTKGGGEAERRSALTAYVLDMTALALSNPPRPDERRCAALARWLPEVRAEGRAALERVRER